MGCTQSKASEPTPRNSPTLPTAPDTQDVELNNQVADDNVGTASPVQAEYQGMTHAPSAPAIQSNSPISQVPAEAAPSATIAIAEKGPANAASGKTDSQGRRTRPAQTMPASLANNVYNGFKASPEIPSFECPDNWLADYTGAIEAFNYVPPQESVISVFKNGDQERKIHNNIELSSSELERLQGMREEAKSQGLEFYPSVTSMATRFLSRARMDPRKAVRLMRETHEWRKDYFKNGPIRYSEVQEDMKHGIVYFCGRDSCLRPAIVIRANRIPAQWYKDRCIDKFIRMLIFCMEYFMRYIVVPGRVENLNVVVDLATLGLSQVPLSALGQVYSVMSHHYIGRVFKFYVCNISVTLSTIAGMAKAMLTDRQKQKLNILDNPALLLKDFAAEQLETDLGGSRPILSEFFPFPMQPGPYNSGFTGKPNLSAPIGAHQCLTHAGAIGRLWDPKLPPDENQKLEYSAKAAEIFERGGLPVPAEARFAIEPDPSFGGRSGSLLPEAGKPTPELTPSTEAELDTHAIQDTTRLHIVDGDVDFGNATVQDEAVVLAGQSKDPDRDLSNAVICGGRGFFCCDLR